MSNIPASRNPDRSHDDDSWEQLEAELFGIPYTKEHVPAPEATVTESRIDEPAASVAEPDRVEPVAKPETALNPAADPEAPSDEFGFDEPAAMTSSGESTSPTPAPASEASSDSYWNALENFDWTQPSDSRPRGREVQPHGDRGRGPRGDWRHDDSRGPRRDGGRRDGGRRPERGHAGPPATHGPAAESRPSAGPLPSPRQPAPAQPIGDEFGSGLLDEALTFPVEPVAPETATTEVNDTDFTLQEPAETNESTNSLPPAVRGDAPHEGDQGDHRRRRRRRRRGRRGDRRDAPAGFQSPPTSEPIASEPDSLRDDDGEPEAEDAVDEFGPADVSPTEPGQSQAPAHADRHSRRRRRGRRGDGDRPAETSEFAGGEQASELEPVAELGGAEPGIEDEEDDAELDVSYGHVPSWEEAISYLLNPSLVEAAAPEASQSGEHGRHSKHRGHRRH
jgi:hypothetical protein